jgi:hypothetical protein
MLGGHSTLNTVVLGEGMSKYQIPPHFGHHSCARSTLRPLKSHRQVAQRNPLLVGGLGYLRRVVGRAFGPLERRASGFRPSESASPAGRGRIGSRFGHRERPFMSCVALLRGGDSSLHSPDGFP